MNRYWQRLFFGKEPIKEFVALASEDVIRERVLLEAGTVTTDVSSRQWLLCLQPVVFGVWVEAGELAADTDGGMEYRLSFLGAGGKVVAVLTLERVDQIDEAQGSLLLLKVKASRIRHLDPFRTYLLYRSFYKKPGFTFGRMKAYAAAFSFPRRVRIISGGQDPEHPYFFPMDLMGEIPAAGRYVFGLRHSNPALATILETGKLAVCEVPASHQSLIYELGKSHREATAPLDQLPFAVIQSTRFGLYIPDWAESYREIRILHHTDLGSQRLLWGEDVSGAVLGAPAPHLIHLHFLYLLNLRP